MSASRVRLLASWYYSNWCTLFLWMFGIAYNQNWFCLLQYWCSMRRRLSIQKSGTQGIKGASDIEWNCNCYWLQFFVNFFAFSKSRNSFWDWRGEAVECRVFSMIGYLSKRPVQISNYKYRFIQLWMAVYSFKPECYTAKCSRIIVLLQRGNASLLNISES